jgi:hypothetical protein
MLLLSLRILYKSIRLQKMFLKSFIIVIASFFILGLSSVFAENIILKNDIWIIEINPANLTSQHQDAQNRIDAMNILAKKDLFLGSEDGGAVANYPIIFANGMQTSGFGWKDDDMRKNKKSPYYLGLWYPNYQPNFFFKSAIVKPKYKHLYFNPKNRLPLFQAVFHDSVITTHHLTIDNLKFSDVRTNTELSQILYNQALVDCKWLDKDGIVQQTTFANGVEAKIDGRAI